MKTALHPLAVACVLALVGCKPQAPSSTSQGSNDRGGDASGWDASGRAVWRTDESYRQQWIRKQFLEAYDKVGSRNPAWDQPVRRAIELYIAFVWEDAEIKGAKWPEFMEAIDEAASSGCTDPLFQFLRAWKNQPHPARATESQASLYSAAAQALEPSGYSEFCKLRAWAGAAQAWKAVRRSAASEEARTAIRPEYVQAMSRYMGRLSGFIRDRQAPVEEVYRAMKEWLDHARFDRGLLPSGWPPLETALAGWPLWMKDLLTAHFYHYRAWQVRGYGYANTVTPQGWQGFRDYLAKAEEAALRAADALTNDVRIPLLMMEIAVGQSRLLNEIEQWFQRAMTIDPDCYDACKTKLWYLEPKWYGSLDALLAFGRECVQSEEWGGLVPLTLVQAHNVIRSYQRTDEAKRNYWHKPEVWQDIKRSYTRYFELNPDRTHAHSTFAWYAYQCGRYDEFLRQIQLAPWVDTERFGGDEAYEKILAEVRSLAR